MERAPRGKNQPPRRQAAEALGSEGSSGGSSKKAKFPLHLKILTDDVFDKFSSIRIPGSKKDRPALPSWKQGHCSSSECTTPAEMEDFLPAHLSDQEILALFEKMMEDMNLNEDRKVPLREKDLRIKKEMVLQYTSAALRQGSLKSRRQIFPQEFIDELKSGTMDEKLVSCLESLRVSLTSNPVSWVENFGQEGLGLLLDILEKLVESKQQDKLLKKIQHKIIQCLKAFMNNKYGLERIMNEERSFSLLAKTIDPKQINMMTDAVKLLSAICIIGDENILEKILKALTTAAQDRGIDRFGPILKGLEENSVHLQIACMQFINALVTTPDDLDFRLHIRNEFMRCGLKERLPLLRCIRNEALDIQLKVFSEHKEEDMIEFSHRLDDIRSEFDDANDVFNLVWNSVKDTSAENCFLSILQHLLLIRNDNFIRPLYFKLIEECVSQVVLHRSGLDPDFSYRKRLDVNFSHILDICIEQKKMEELEGKASEFLKKFEKEFVAHQETKAQLQKTEEKLGLLDGGRKPYKNEISPQEMTENCFWVMANDGKYESTDLLCKLELTFCCQKNVKRDEGFDERKPIKRIKELKVLDPKIAQNLSIFLGSFRVPYEEIKIMILEIDETQLSESMIQNLIKHLPDQKQLNELSKLKNEYKNLSDPEQFAIVMSSVTRLRPRLGAILFKLQFEEQVNNTKPEIMAVSTACEEIKQSRGFSQLLELVLLMGNYMNAGSRNAQTFGFNLCSLCKLKDTKSADQTTTLLHFLVEICEEKYPNVLSFLEDLQHLDKASRVSAESLEKSLKQMEGQIKQLESDLKTFPQPEDVHDKFVTKMSSFLVQAKEQFKQLSTIHKSMENLYRDVMEYYAIDLKKISVEEFLTDLSNFKTMFLQAAKDNMRRKEMEEKQRRARIAQEKAEKEKREKQQKKKHLLDIKTEKDETGVMDSLLEALQSGAAFRNRRKQAPRFKVEPQDFSSTSTAPVLKPCNHENQKAPTGEKLHPHHSMHGTSVRNPTCKDSHRKNEANPSVEKRNSVGKRKVTPGGAQRRDEIELGGAKGDVIPEVEALLARLRAL
ncbi:protein diaphanous homolog 3 isoform X3 [Crotalus tigris]|uniref:protein diaphanous homolog 3 isoform X3 n=1 Tax=Crotalus tigris TaxID=88082 RepID=UPI00192F8B5E|nr:protein diaphanous homolog 3 isoform X3 [Crotalus tigris]